jgi:hypothetical protein
MNGKNLRIVVIVEVYLPNSTAVLLWALYNSGAEINLITRKAVKIHNLQYALAICKLIAKFLDDNSLSLYKLYNLTLSCTDSEGAGKAVGLQRFWAVDFNRYDIVLGYPWLREADP